MEKTEINKVLDFDKIKKNYDARCVDKTKTPFNKKKPSDQDIKDYMIIWSKMFFKHPICYIESVINTQIQSFNFGTVNLYTDRTTYKLKHMYMNSHRLLYKIDTQKLHFKSNQSIDAIGVILDKVLRFISNTPILGMITLPALYLWFMFIVIFTAIHKKEYKSLLFFFVYLLYLGTLLLGPCDAIYEFRYIFPFMISFPIFYLIWKNIHIKKSTYFHLTERQLKKKK